MKEHEIYQQHLAESVAQVINWQNGVTEYLTRLAEMKAKRIWQSNVGKVFKSDELKDDAMVVAVGFKVRDDIWKNDSNWKKYAITIQVAFVRDLKPMLESNRKQITDKERKYLKRLQEMRDKVSRESYFMYNDYDRKSSALRLYEEAFDIQNEMSWHLKNKIKAVHTAEWAWSLEQVLDPEFLTEGLNYDNQTLLCREKSKYEY